MITLKSIFEQLAYVELSQLGTVDEKLGVIEEEQYPKVISQINLVLMDLYTKFPLNVKELKIAAISGRSDYPLEMQYAKSDPTVGIDKFILDSEAAPFLDDIIRFDSVVNQRGENIPINDAAKMTSIFTPTYDLIQMPHAVDGDILYFSYRAKHERLDPENSDLENTYVFIPPILLEPLLSYVASRIHQSRPNPEAVSLATSYMNKYVAQCNQVINKNTLNSEDITTNERFKLNGWK